MIFIPRAILTLSLITSLALAAGCGGKIGDSCTTSKSCPEMCQTGGGFPGGICTLECDSTDQCPEGWACISDSSGICMEVCTTEAECIETYNDLWTCEDRSLQSGSGNALVCYGA